MSRNIIFSSVFVVIIAGVLAGLYFYRHVPQEESAPTPAEPKPSLSGTVHIYPTEFQEHDILYFRVELQNKNDVLVMGYRTFQRDYGCGLSLWESADCFYHFPYDGACNWGIMTQQIDPNESFVAVHSWVEFPEYITLLSRRKYYNEEVVARNKQFVEQCIGTGKKCALGVRLMETGVFSSEPIIEVKSRSAEEMAAIEAWYAEFNNFLSDTSRQLEHRAVKDGDQFPYSWKKVPAVKDYEEFEKRLSPGTFKNYVHFRKLLASIPDDLDTDIINHVPDEHFTKLDEYLDTLHPIERDALIRDALWYFSERSNNGKKMKYLLLPKLARSERARYFGETSLEEQKMFLDLPEPE
jgi:hypothetical protein